MTRLTPRRVFFAPATEIRHTCVVKKNWPFDEVAEGGGSPGIQGRDLPIVAVPVQVGQEGRTRHEVARQLLEQGPITAAAVAERLGISPAAVRRHLDALLADGEAESREAPSRAPRGRGRPAKSFILTDAGRARFGHAYDDLAVSAIRFLAEHGGKDAIRAFAEHRVATLVGPHHDAIMRDPDPTVRAEALATALTREGYAASTERVGIGGQLCQHHCPVAHVAAEFPQLCEAETAAFAELLGTHVQRLATIARGDAACTTHVPVRETSAHHPHPANPARATGRKPGTRNEGNSA
ncbi:MAG: winged helix-turn-helix transcriptional regulator [Actinophytocola sp.]|nr:winged helix-turn-helix transcriptional regulator [Actinophytocola sp.]